MPDSSPAPGPTPSGYQRTTGGKFRWQPPPVEKLQSLLSGYDVISLIGHGGMGAVYRARQKSLDRLVAIKILPPEAAADDATFADRFKNEARTMAKMNHPGIVHVHDFGETADGQLYIVMEFVEGTDVQRMLMDHKVLTAQYALPITAHVCDALEYAHTHGVTHRDIKPANIMLTSEGKVKVADFGLAKHEDGGAAGSLTQTNMSMGTPDYVAPETLTIGMTVDHRADLYAVGVMLYHMLVGEVPRGAFDLPSVRNAALDPRIDAIVLRAMKQNRDERYQSAAEIRADLDAILATPEVKSGGEPSSVISKRVVVQSQKNFARTAPAPVRSGGKKESAAMEAQPPEQPGSAGKTGGLAWIVPTGISAVVILGGAFFLRGQRQKDVAPASPASMHETSAKSQGDGALPAGPIKVADHTPAKPAPPPADANFSSALVPGCWTHDNKDSHMLLLADGGVRLLRRGKEDLRPDGTPWWKGWRWKHDGGLVHLHAEDGKEVETLELTAPGEGRLTKLSKNETQTSKRVPLAAPGIWCPVRFPGDKAPKGSWENGLLHLPPREQCQLPDPYAARDAAIRAKITVDSGDGSYKGLYFKLRNGNALGFFDLGARDIANVGAQPDYAKDVIILGKSAKAAFPLGRKELLVEFAAVGDDLILAIEGRTVVTAKTNAAGKVPNASGNRAQPPFKTLIQGGWSGATLRDLEFMPLDGVSADLMPGFIMRGREAGIPFPALASASKAPAPATPVTAAAPPVPAPAAPPPVAAKPKLPAELLELQTGYAAAIAERVTSPHDASVKQLNTAFTAALDRAVTARQLGADAVAADKKAIQDTAPLPPDLDTTPEPLKTLRATYRAKSAEYDDTRTTAHLALLTPYIAKLKQLEADLTKAARIPDAEIVKSYRESLGENPFALPDAKP